MIHFLNWLFNQTVKSYDIFTQNFQDYKLVQFAEINMQHTEVMW